jgi:hypothetical protein
MVIIAAGPGVPLAVKTALSGPRDAVNEWVPAFVPMVQYVLAVPVESVGVVGLSTDPLLVPRVQITLAPEKGLPAESVTTTTSGSESVAPTIPDWPLPFVIVMAAAWLTRGGVIGGVVLSPPQLLKAIASESEMT